VPQPFLGCLPFVQSLPLARDRAPLSEPHTPVQLSTDVQRRDHSGFGIPPWFHRLPCSRTVAWIPHGPGSPFGERAHLPVAPDPARRRPPRSASFTCFEVLIPPASPFGTATSLPATARRCSPGYAPLQLSPLTPQALMTRPSPASLRFDLRPRLPSDSGLHPEDRHPASPSPPVARRLELDKAR
jgi:hypothetical protein